MDDAAFSPKVEETISVMPKKGYSLWDSSIFIIDIVVTLWSGAKTG